MRLKTSGPSARGIKRHIVLRTRLRYGGGAAVAVIMSGLVIVENSRTYVYKRLHVTMTITVIYVRIYRYIYGYTVYLHRVNVTKIFLVGKTFFFYFAKKIYTKIARTSDGSVYVIINAIDAESRWYGNNTPG